MSFSLVGRKVKRKMAATVVKEEHIITWWRAAIFWDILKHLIQGNVRAISTEKAHQWPRKIQVKEILWHYRMVWHLLLSCNLNNRILGRPLIFLCFIHIFNYQSINLPFSNLSLSNQLLDWVLQIVTIGLRITTQRPQIVCSPLLLLLAIWGRTGYGQVQ